MIVLGLDPGSQFTGYGVIRLVPGNVEYVASGVIQTGSQSTFSQKLSEISLRLEKVYSEFQPRVTVVERVFLGKNADSAFKLGHVRGVCMMQAASHENKVVEIAARKAKKLVTGSGNATKEHMQFLVQQSLGIEEFRSLDESDALGLCLAFWKLSIEQVAKTRVQGEL